MLTLRDKGYALLEYDPASAKAQASAASSPATTAAPGGLPLRYVLDQAGDSNLYRLTLMVGNQSITRPYLVQDGTLCAGWVLGAQGVTHEQTKPIRWHQTPRLARCRRRPASGASTTCPCTSLAAVLAAFLLVMTLVAADRAAKQNAPASGPNEKAGNTSMFAKEIVGDKDRRHH